MKELILLSVLVCANAVCQRDCCGAASFRIDVFESTDCTGTPLKIIEDSSMTTYVCQPLGDISIDIGYVFVCNRKIYLGCVDCNSIDHSCQDDEALSVDKCRTITSFNSSDTKVYSIFIHGLNGDEKTTIMIVFLVLAGIFLSVVCVFWVIPTIRRKYCASYRPIS